MLRAILLCLSLCLALPNASFAQSAQSAVQVEVLPGWRQAPGRHVAGLKIALAPGWKTYWRVPGDAGIPPHIEWDTASGVSGLTLQWPVPEPFEILGLSSIGYKGTVILPLHLAVGQGPARLKGLLEIGVCKDICVPVHIPLDVALPENGPRDAGLAAALLDRAMSAQEAGAGPLRCRFEPNARGFHLEMSLALKPLGGHETVVVELQRQDVWVSENPPHRQDGVLYASADLLLPRGQPAAIDRSKLRVTVIGDGQAVEVTGCQS